ncbi:hypothetical protein tb265_10500 [Gemmatimonadetes bacterium T265]|nr:hypothetical protein tb265_10500 [Gemmatimonadetes bacterium T265]
MPAALPPATWAHVKRLFAAAQDATPTGRTRLLDDPALDPTVRAYVVRLLDADASLGARLETSHVVFRPDASGGARAHAGWAEAPSLVGRRLGPYVVLERLGQGGMGAVYTAARADDAYQHRVALKTLWRGADSAVLARRFRSERQILAGLQHPNIAQLLDGGATDEGTPYLVMEYVEGEPIDRYCDARRLPIPARLDLFRQVCAAVAYAHRNLVVHRDLKPGNVLVTADGTAKLLDFGVAKLVDDPRAGSADPGTLTGAGLAPFTATYAAPEQLAGGRVSTATDVYALGALLTVLLAGRPPFGVDGLTADEMRWAFARDGRAPVAPSALARADGDGAAAARGFASSAQHARALRGELDAIAGMALRDDPARRYATADALAEDVRRYLRRDRVLARPDTVAYRVRSFARRQRALMGGVAVAAAALVVGSGVALWEARESRREADRSERVAAFLQTMLGAPDATTGGVVTRVGRQATLAEVLDSAVRRVPAAFPADPRVRARLYTAIGATYVAQDRARAAAAVLDSAVVLAGASYGPRSTAFAEASLAAGLAALRMNGFAAAERHLDAACAALPAHDAAQDGTLGELRARVVGARATLALARGRGRAADSLATEVIAAEEARTRAPTAARAWALRVLGTVRRDSDDAHFVHAIAIMDSLGAPMAVERLDALLGHGGLLAAAGALAASDSVLREGIRLATLGYGPRSREAAHFRAYRAASALARHDTATAVAEADSALATLAALPDVIAPVQVDIVDRSNMVLAALGRWDAVLREAERLRAFGRANDAALATTSGALWAAHARLRRGDSAGAAVRLREVLATWDADGVPAEASREVRARLDTLRARGFDGRPNNGAPRESAHD